MVENAPRFATVFERLQPLIGGTVMVGHHITFDLHMLRRECGLAEVEWDEPPWLDTLLLAAALEPDIPALSLDALADRFGVGVHGRHTALGDSLVTAEKSQHQPIVTPVRPHQVETTKRPIQSQAGFDVLELIVSPHEDHGRAALPHHIVRMVSPLPMK